MDHRALRVLLLLFCAHWAQTHVVPDGGTEPPVILDDDLFPQELNFPLDGNARVLYQGDMMLTDEQWRSLLQRKAIADVNYRWPKSADGMVHIEYRYDDAIVSRPGVLKAMAAWEAATCVRFHEISSAVTKPHLIFKTSTAFCNSAVGYISGMNGQDINVMPSCFDDDDTVVHELGHAMGLQHEQSRSDRDDYLYIMSENVQSGKEHNFNKEVTNNYNLPYDYSSVMQYHPTAFSKNNLATIVAKDPLAQPLIKDHKGLSFMDKKIINLMYNCTDTWLAACPIKTDPCMNQGYTKTDCNCECPAGTSGVYCETLIQPYTAALINAKSPGSERITTAGTVTSPGYPTPVTTATTRVQSIEAPECHKVQLTFNVFNMQGLSNLSYDNFVNSSFQACWNMILEIKLDDPPITGTEFCGGNITAPQTFESKGRFMVLTFSNRDMAGNTKTGYSATVKFIPMTSDNCTSSTPATSNSTSVTTTTPTIITSTTTPTTTPTATPTTTSTTPTTTPTTTTPPTTTPSTITPPTTTPPTTTTPTTTSPTTTLRTTTTPTTTLSTTTSPTTTPPTTTSTTTAAPSPGKITNSGRLPLTPSIANGQCSLVSSSNPSIFFYRSPNYPSNYGKGVRCTIWFNTTEPRYLKVTPLTLSLGSADSVDLFYPYQNTSVLVPSKVGTAITLPTSSSRLSFVASTSSPGGKFDFRVEVVNTGCHQLIELQAGSTGTLSIPANYPAGTVCEWWLRAPANRKVQVSFSRFFIGGSTCLRDSVVIDVSGDTRYVSGSKQYCGGNIYSPGTVVSTANALNILVNGQWGNYQGLEATYTVV